MAQIVARSDPQIELSVGRMRTHSGVGNVGSGNSRTQEDKLTEVNWRDIAHWIADPETPLPSGADTNAESRLAGGGTGGGGKEERGGG